MKERQQLTSQKLRKNQKGNREKCMQKMARMQECIEEITTISAGGIQKVQNIEGNGMIE